MVTEEGWGGEQRTRMTMAQALVRFLIQQYSERDSIEQRLIPGIFGIFGHGNVSGLGQALEEVGHELPYHQARNEQAMVHTAAAYARMKNRLQILACTSSVGPGATNMLTGAAGATINRIPVLLLPGDVFASRLPHPVLQQLEYFGGQDVSVNDAFRPLSRYWDRITRPEQLLSSLPEAMRVLTNPAETGAVTVALPEDVQTMAWDFPHSFFRRRVHHQYRQPPAPTALRDAVQAILSAQRPLIVAGGGAIYAEASDALDGFCRAFGIPVVETQAGKGVLPWDHPWNAGAVGATGGLAGNRLAAKADLVIALGTRLDDFTTASKSAFQHPSVRFIGLNICAADAGKLSGLPLVADARSALESLSQALQAAGYHTAAEYEVTVRRLNEEWRQAVELQLVLDGSATLTQAQVIGLVNQAMRPQDVLVCASGGLPGDLHKLWRSQEPKSYHVEYGYSCMGYEIAGGHGVKMADPAREVYVVVGDGSYLMLHTEIVTSLQEGNKLIVVVFDNSGFQCIRSLQTSLGSPSFGNEMRYRDSQSGRLQGDYLAIDFVKNAESLGALGYFAASAEDLRQALAEAQSAPRTVVIHVPVDAERKVPSYEGWWDVPVAEVSAQTAVVAARHAYEAARRRQRAF